MKIFYYSSALALLLLSQSCKTTSFRISVKEPAVVKIDEKYQNFGIINHVDNTNSPEKVVTTVLTGQQINGNVAASENAGNGIVRALQNSNEMQAQQLENTAIFNDDRSLNWNVIDSLADTMKLDAIIELVELRTLSNVGGSLVASASGQNSYLDGTLYFTVHFLDTSLRLDRLAVKDHYVIPVSGSGNIVDILGDVQRKREYYRTMGFNLGYAAGQLLYPKWVWVGRTYYAKGSKVLKRAQPMILKGNWEIAEKQLLKDFDHPKEKIRGRVLYNLALVNEGMGDIDRAIAYAEQAALECGDKLANAYLVDLRNRKYQIEQLNQ